MRHSNKITYYDFNDFYYSSFFLTGFHQNASTFPYKFLVSKAKPPLLSDPIMGDEWKSILPSICLFKANLSGENFYFCIDLRDSCNANLAYGNGYHLPLLTKVKFYFKVNYNENAIFSDPNLSAFASKIIPVFPFCPIFDGPLFKYLPRLVPCKTTGWTLSNAARRVKALCNIPTLAEITQMRNLQKDLDIFFITTFYHEEKHSGEMEFRYKIMEEIKKNRNIKSLIGFVSNKEISGKYSEFRYRLYSLKEYLNRLAKSRVAIYVRGLHNCLSFKFVEFLSLGLPIAGQTILNNRRNLMCNKFFVKQFAYDNPKQIVQEAITMLNNSELLIKLGASNAKTFDAKFSPRAVVSDLLKHLT